MKKFTLLIASLFITIGAMAQTPINSADFDASKTYRIYNKATDKGDVTWKAMSYNNNGKGCLKDYNANDETLHWKFVANGDGYRLYNVSAQKYLGAMGGDSGASMVATEASAATYNITPDEDGQRVAFWHTDINQPRNYLWNDGGNNLFGWKDDSKNHMWYLEEVVTDGVKVSFTYSYTYKGEVLATANVSGFVGSAYPNPLDVPFGFAAAKPDGNVEESLAGQTVTIELTVDLPFEYFASESEITKWYFVQIHSNNRGMMWDNNGAMPFASNSSVANDDTRANYAWGFVGDPINGFKVVNKGTGNAIHSSGVNETDATTGDVASAALWIVKPSSAMSAKDYFTLMYKGSENIYLNANTPQGKVSHWNEADAGSTIRLSDYSPMPDMSFPWSASNLAMWGSALNVADYPSTVINDAVAGATKYVHRAEAAVTTNGACEMVATFRYSTGACALQMLGVDIIDANGNIVAADYHVGKAGGSHENNVYRGKVAEAGNYTMRCYVWTDGTGNGDGKERLDDTNGTITVSFYEAQPADFTNDVTFAAEYATLHLGYKVAVPSGVEAYIVTGTDNNYAQMTQVVDVIPAATPVILKKVGSESAYTFAYTEDAATTDVTANKLEGSIVDRYVADNAYVLANGEVGIGLYTATKNQLSNTAFKNNANKAYLPKTTGMNAASYSFRFGEGTTGIENVVVENDVKAIYDLTGRRVEVITAPGIYVVNGKKVLVK